MPVRKITNTGSRKNTGLVPSLKNERPIAYESLIERDCIYLFEFDDTVISFSEQPLRISYIIANKSHYYTPDFQVYYRNSKTVIFEVKPQTTWDKIKENESKYLKYIAANRYCIANGFEFRILTDIDLRSGSLLKNIKFLFGYSRLEVPASVKLYINNVLYQHGSISICELLSYLADLTGKSSSVNYQYVLSLLYSKYFKTNLDILISKSSLISQ